MPNHFHIMVLVNRTEINTSELQNSMNNNHEIMSQEDIDIIVRKNFLINIKTRTLNTSISILLISYTRAINKQENRTGSLFKSHTKAECINCVSNIKPSFIHSNNRITNILPKNQYPQICFDYILHNPVKAKLVKNAIDWEFSSAKDYADLRNGKLINKEVAEEYVDF